MEPNLSFKAGQIGSPLITPDLIFFYFVIFLSLVGVIYFTYHYIKKPENPNHFKNLFILGVALKLLILIGSLLVSAFYFLPTPNINKTSPGKNYQNVPASSRIEIQFDRPVSRSNLIKKITPDVPGIWQYEVGLYNTHFYRKLIFYPDVSLLPDTQYKVDLENISNVSRLSKVKNHTFTFKTTSLPEVSNVQPDNDSQDIAPNREIIVNLDKPNDNLADFNFILTPETEFDVSRSSNKTTYFLTPKQKFKQGTKYQLKILKSPIQYNSSGNVVFHGEEKEEYITAFTTKFPPEIQNFSPTGDQLLINSQFEIEFTKPVVKFTVNKNFYTNNGLEGKIVWQSDKKLSFIPTNLRYDTNYSLNIGKGIVSYDGAVSESNISMEFKTIGPIKLLSSSSNSKKDNQGISINNSIKFNFDQQVDRLSAQEHFSINPAVDGDFSWNGNTMIFKPKSKLEYDTNYLVSISPAVQSVKGLNSKDTFNLNFNTESFIFKLAVPAYLQKYSLSCEVAALNMILSFRGFKTSEDELLNLVGFDNTPRQNGVWGDPNVGFVGDIKGRQMRTGYGVYWGPIERVAKNFRDAKAFSGWSLAQITDQVLKGNPVIIWGYSRGGVSTSWTTLQGKEIFAVSGEHTLVITGFVGKAENPKQIIVNDSLIGEVYLPQSTFNQKWDSFGRSGVVVF